MRRKATAYAVDPPPVPTSTSPKSPISAGTSSNPSPNASPNASPSPSPPSTPSPASPSTTTRTTAVSVGRFTDAPSTQASSSKICRTRLTQPAHIIPVTSKTTISSAWDPGVLSSADASNWNDPRPSPPSSSPAPRPFPPPPLPLLRAALHPTGDMTDCCAVCRQRRHDCCTALVAGLGFPWTGCPPIGTWARAPRPVRELCDAHGCLWITHARLDAANRPERAATSLAARDGKVGSLAADAHRPTGTTGTTGLSRPLTTMDMPIPTPIPIPIRARHERYCVLQRVCFCLFSNSKRLCFPDVCNSGRHGRSAGLQFAASR